MKPQYIVVAAMAAAAVIVGSVFTAYQLYRLVRVGAEVRRQIGLAFCTPRGRFLDRVCGEGNGNVLLRRTRYRAADDLGQCCQISRTHSCSTLR